MNEKKYYLIYQVTNNVNGKIYIGKHETNNLDDDYFGSGVALNEAINKYGIENFTKTILFYCANREEMNLLEQFVVTNDFIKRHDVYNMCPGGEGGDTWTCAGRKHSQETKDYLRQLSYIRYSSKKKEHILLSNEEKRKRISNGVKLYYDKIGRKKLKKPPMPFKSVNASGKMIKVHLENEEHTIYECDLQWYLDNGWQLGRNLNNKKPIAKTEEAKNASSGKGKRIIHNKKIKQVKRIDPSQIEEYLNNGWELGYLNK